MDKNNQVVSCDGYESLLLKIFNLNRKQLSTLLPLDQAKIAWLENVLSKITPREEKVLRLRCGLGSSPKYTLQEIADDFGVSRERIRNLEEDGINKIRHFLKKSEARFIRDDQGAVIAFVAFFSTETEQLVISQQQQVEKVGNKNAELLKQVLTLSDKLQAALKIIDGLNAPNEKLAQLKADLKAVEESLDAVESFGEIIAKLKKLKSAGDQFKLTYWLIDELLNAPVDKSLLAHPVNVQELVADAYDLIPNFSQPIDFLDLSVRTRNCLFNAGLKTVGDLIQKSEIDLLKLKNFGRKCLNEAKEVLAIYKLRLGMKYPDDFIDKM